MTPSPLAGRHAMSGTWDSIDARFDEQMRETVRRVIDARAADQPAIDANRLEERIAGFDSSPWGVS